MSTALLDNPEVFESAAPDQECSALLEEAAPSRLGTTTIEFQIEFFSELLAAIMERDMADSALIDSRRGEPTEPLEQVLTELGIG
jgi:hypothetical protein